MNAFAEMIINLINRSIRKPRIFITVNSDEDQS